MRILDTKIKTDKKRNTNETSCQQILHRIKQTNSVKINNITNIKHKVTLTAHNYVQYTKYLENKLNWTPSEGDKIGWHVFFEENKAVVFLATLVTDIPNGGVLAPRYTKIGKPNAGGRYHIYIPLPILYALRVQTGVKHYAQWHFYEQNNKSYVYLSISYNT